LSAGGGAAEQARRAAERESRLERQLDHARRARLAWETGAEGERVVAKALTTLEVAGWRVLHDVHWPGRPFANLDHVLVGPGGVVVLDTKNWSGRVEVRDGVLRQNGYRRQRETAAVLDQAAAVAALLEPPYRTKVVGMICAVGQPDLLSTTIDGVRVVGLDHLLEVVAGLPVVLDDLAVGAVQPALTALLTGPSAPPLVSTRAFGGKPAVREPRTRRQSRRGGGPDAKRQVRRDDVRRGGPPGGPARRAAVRRRSARGRRSAGADVRDLLVKLVLVVVLLALAKLWLAQLTTTPATTPGPRPATTQSIPAATSG
jgi:hypothetical protein